jgi:hypothetical protein
MIAPYPTFGEISRKAAAGCYAPKLFGAGRAGWCVCSPCSAEAVRRIGMGE